MTAAGYFLKQEKHILDVLGRGLLNEFPNPERNGCPGSDVLRRIASHEMPLSEAEKWLDHLTSCSPCYDDFLRLRVSQKRRRTRTLLAIAAGILIVMCLAGWAWFARQGSPVVAQTAVLDLRNRSVARGGEPNPSDLPLQISRKARHWTIYLPLGSSDGPYDVRLVTPSGEALLETSGVAKLTNGVTILEISAALPSHRSGRYFLHLGRNSSREASYMVELK